MHRSEAERTVVIADDHAVVRSGLRNILSSLQGVRIIGEAANGLEAIAHGKRYQPSMMTLDAGMPMCNGMEVLGEVRRWSPRTRICVVTGFTSVGSLADWRSAGVDGLFLKSSEPAELREGFRRILTGSTYLQHDIRCLLDDRQQVVELTLRERQILHQVALGLSNGEIAEKLSISPKTVDNHRSRLMAKLGVHSVAQLVAYALKEGLLEPARQA
ncbi:response regulator transcription factor [Aquibium sp. LZ166]|uniref:Response regulator transcription factor n=1 Tax=Aquibium pacificus TaxID=3153579 RepID=A0ABV3SDV5_9HYPH